MQFALSKSGVSEFGLSGQVGILQPVCPPVCPPCCPPVCESFLLLLLLSLDTTTSATTKPTTANTNNPTSPVRIRSLDERFPFENNLSVDCVPSVFMADISVSFLA